MKRFLLLYLLFFSPFSIFAQKAAYVEYDYYNPAKTRVGYIGSANDTIFSHKRIIKVKGATPCIIRLLNYNTEALQTTSTLRKGTNMDSVSAVNFSGFVNTLSTLVNPSIGINFSNLLPKGRGMLRMNVEMANLHPNFDELQVDDQEDALVKYDTIIRNKLSDINNWKLLLNRLNQLRFNTNFSRDETKKKTDELLKTLSADAPIVLKDEVKSRIVVRQLARENTDYLRFALASFQKQIDNPIASRGISNQINEYELAKENIKEYQKYVNNDTEAEVRQVMDNIVSSYQAILNNPFETKMNLVIEENIDLLQLNMYPVNEKGQRVSKEPIQSQPFLVKIPGSVTILNTVGISFVQFIDPIKSYAVNSSAKIVSSLSDKILPSFSFYMHFVGRGSGTVKLGGHFGVGVPLTESKSVNFQLGPTLVVGAQNAICLNFGMIAGRVQRLSGGLKEGDSYTSTSPLPTVNRYELGYQVGLSFNVPGLLKK